MPKGTIVAAGMFGSAGGGAAAGNRWGDDIGRSAGSAAGMIGSEAAVSHARDLPPQVCVAVNPETVYLLSMPKAGYEHLEPFAKIDRTRLGVEVHQRFSVRTVVLEDLDTDARFPLELPRLHFYHGKALLELLNLNERYHDAESGAEPKE